MSNLLLPRRVMPVDAKHFGPKASTLRVKVYYHPTNPDGSAGRSNHTEMSHEGYFKWLADAPKAGLILESVEQIRND